MSDIQTLTILNANLIIIKKKKIIHLDIQISWSDDGSLECQPFQSLHALLKYYATTSILFSSSSFFFIKKGVI
jgi:hypothetical protein